MLKEYKTVSEISGPLMMVEGVENAKFGHMVDIELTDGTMRHGQILQVQGDKVMVQVFEGTSGIDVSGTTVRFLGKPMELGVSPDILGRVFSGTGVP
ncbi:MAG: V-type ATP synthase subunit B, partial [Planctomycetota bacterium]